MKRKNIRRVSSNFPPNQFLMHIFQQNYNSLQNTSINDFPTAASSHRALFEKNCMNFTNQYLATKNDITIYH